MASPLDLVGPLLVRPQPLHGEGLRGFFLRVGELNGLLPQVDLYRGLFSGETNAAATRSKLVGVAESTGLSFEALDGLGSRGLSRAPSRTCRFAGHRVALAQLRTGRCVLCPRCIAGTAALYASWELSAVVACPRHACWLIDECPRCRTVLSWRRPGVAICGCGIDLRRTPVSTAPAAVCALTAIIEQRLGGELPTGAGSSFGFPAELETMPVNQLLGLFHLLTNAKLSEAQDRAPEMACASAMLRSEAATACAAADALLHWPAGWRSLQERVNAGHFERSSLKERGLVTHREALAPLVAIERTSWSAAADYPAFARSELRAFLRDRVVEIGRHCLYTTGSRLTPGPPGQRRLSKLHSWRRHDVATSRFSAAAVIELMDATPHQMELLKSVGVLKRSGQAWMPGADLDRAFVALAGTAQGRSRVASPRDLIPLADFSRRSGEALARHVHDIRSGRTSCYTWAHCTPPGLCNLFIPAEQAVRYRNAVGG